MERIFTSGLDALAGAADTMGINNVQSKDTNNNVMIIFCITVSSFLTRELYFKLIIVIVYIFFNKFFHPPLYFGRFAKLKPLILCKKYFRYLFTKFEL